MMKSKQVSVAELTDYFNVSLKSMIELLIIFLEEEIDQFDPKNPQHNCYMYQTISRIEEIYGMIQGTQRGIPYYKRYQVLRNRLFDLAHKYQGNNLGPQTISISEELYLAIHLQPDFDALKPILERVLINAIDKDTVLYPFLHDYIDSMGTDYYLRYKTIIMYILEHQQIKQMVLLKIIYYFKEKLSSNEVFYQYGDDIVTFIKQAQDRIVKQDCLINGVGMNQMKQPDSSKVFIFTIDPSCTHLREDAISIVQDQKYYYVTLYVTDPGDMMLKHPNLLQHGYHKWFQDEHIIFPESYNCQYFSLDCAKQRPVLAYELVLDQTFNVVELNLREDQIVVDQNYSFQAFNALLKQDQVPDTLQTLYGIAYHYHKQNQAKVYYHTLKQLRRFLQLDRQDEKTNGAGELIVQELKILVQHIMAKFCYENKIPCIYRNNNVQNWESYLALDRDQVVNDQFLDGNTGSFYSDVNSGHYGLNFDCYMHTTTTVRNFFAFVNSMIMKDVLLHGNYSHMTVYEEQIHSLIEQQQQKVIDRKGKTLQKYSSVKSVRNRNLK